MHVRDNLFILYCALSNFTSFYCLNLPPPFFRREWGQKERGPFHKEKVPAFFAPGKPYPGAVRIRLIFTCAGQRPATNASISSKEFTVPIWPPSAIHFFSFMPKDVSPIKAAPVTLPAVTTAMA